LKDKIYIYIDTGDDVIDWRESEDFFKGFYFKKYKGGTHYFDHMKELIDDLNENLKDNPFKIPEFI